MKNETMTIHEALAELKILDSRITDKMNDTNFAFCNKHSNTKVNGQPIEDVIISMNADYQSITDLIARRRAIRNAVSLSNASTKVTIAGTEYTVAEAIEMKKNGMNILHCLANHLVSAYTNASNTYTRLQEQINEKADQYVIGLLGSKDKLNTADAQVMRQAYIDTNSFDLIFIKELPEKVKKLQEYIAVFEAEVDAKLSISNALTTITIEY